MKIRVFLFVIMAFLSFASMASAHPDGIHLGTTDSGDNFPLTLSKQKPGYVWTLDESISVQKIALSATNSCSSACDNANIKIQTYDINNVETFRFDRFVHGTANNVLITPNPNTVAKTVKIIYDGTASYTFTINDLDIIGVKQEIIVPQVSQITAVPTSIDAIKISWTEPTDKTFFDGVELVHGTQTFQVPKGTREYNVTGLSDNTIYDFSIRSYYADKYSEYQNVSAKTPEIIVPKVSQIVAMPLSDSEIKISWTEPADKTYFDGVELVHGTKTFQVPKGTREYIVTELQENMRYDFKIRSYYTAKNKYSEYQSFFATTLEKEKLPPQEIKNLQSFVYNDRIKFTWDNPDDTLHHEVRIYRDGNQIATAVTPASSFTDYDLQEHSTYTFVFFTVTTDQRRSAGISVTETTKGMPRGKVQGLRADPSDQQAEISFFEHPEATQGYNIYLDGVKAKTVTDTFTTLTNLQNDREYSVRVSALNEWGESDLSDPIKVKPEKPTLPAKPDIKFTATNESITYQWNPVRFATSYKLYDKDKQFIEETTQTSYTLTGLTAGESKTIYVSSVNDLGESELSKATGKAKIAPSFSKLILPFNVSGMLSTAVSFLKLYGQWILIAIGVYICPYILYGLAMKIILSIQDKKQDDKSRSNSKENRDRRSRRYAGMSKDEWEKFKKEEIQRTNEYFRKTGRVYKSEAREYDRIHNTGRKNKAEHELRQQREQRERRTGRAGRAGRLGRV